MKVRVFESVATTYELPDDHFDKVNKQDGIEMEDWSDCEIAYEFKKYGKKIDVSKQYEDDLLAWVVE